MSKNYFILIACLLAFSLCACDEYNKQKAYNEYDKLFGGGKTEEVEPEPEAKPEPEKKSQIFYQKLLERFCEENYSNCFSGRDFISNSLIVDYVTYTPRVNEYGEVVRYDGNVSGEHSFEGRLGKTYSGYKFNAIVSEEEEGYYKIYFQKESWHPIDGKVMDEDATRTMYYQE